MVKLKFVHSVCIKFVIEYCILLKTSLSESGWVTRHKYRFHDDSVQV